MAELTELHAINDDELKKLQQKNLEIAKYIFDFCKKHEIKAFLFAGSMLGAVRHGGFIPWDDDIDIAMMRPDLERLIDLWPKYANTEKYSLTMQTKEYNDHTLSSKIRDNNTTFITIDTKDLDVNQGLGIDLCGFYACPKTRLGDIWQIIWASMESLFMAGRLPARQKKIIYYLSKIAYSIFRTDFSRYKMWRLAEKIAARPNKQFDKAEYVREFSMFPFILWRYPKWWFEEIKYVTFEDTELPIPIGAHEYLSKRYGNYMEFPPEKDRHPEHRVYFMDLDTPYADYRGKKYYTHMEANR